MKVLVLGDTHGVSYDLSVIKDKGYDLVVATGDFCESDKVRELAFAAIKKFKEEKKGFPDWKSNLSSVEVKELIDEGVFSGRKILEQINSLGVKCFLIPGNADWVGKGDDKTVEKYEEVNHFKKTILPNLTNLNSIHFSYEVFGDFVFIGYGVSSRPEGKALSEFNSLSKEKQVEEVKLYKKNKELLRNIFLKVKKLGKKIVLVSHSPPYKTDLDVINNPDSPRDGEHVGSVIVRELIQEFKPYLSLSGHMHEHGGKWVKVGSTQCYNTGFRTNSASLIDLSKSFPNNEVKK